MSEKKQAEPGGPAAPPPRYASVEGACAWLAGACGGTWTLETLLERGLCPWVWIDYSPSAPEVIFQGRTEGFLFKMVFGGDTHRLASGVPDALLTMTILPDGRLARITPGHRFSLDQLRFKREDLERLASIKGRPAVGDADSTARADAAEMREMRAGGATDVAIGKRFKISRQRVAQLIGSKTAERVAKASAIKR